MMLRFLKYGRRAVHVAVLFLLISAVGPVRALDFFAGVRGGAALEGSPDRFHQAEAFGGIDLPCRWYFWSNWFLRPGADASAGWISDDDTSGFVGTIGPLVELGKGRFPLTLEGGFAPTLLSRHRFSSRNFGDDFQFTSHVGLNWKITRHFTMGVRFQHMSNAGITHFNPGVNLEMLSLRFDF